MTQESSNLQDAGAIIFRFFGSLGEPTVRHGLADEMIIETRKTWGPLKVTKIMPTATVATEATEIDTEDLHEFKGELAALSEDVIAIQSDTGEYGERHITTFILEKSEPLSLQIINIEAKIIRKYPQRDYSFHIRTTPKDKDGKFLLPSGSYYLMTWQSRS